MARQAETKVIGTIGNVTFYKMGEEYFVRMKSCLTGERFFRDKAFEGSRRSCARLAEGSRLASAIYKMLPERKRCYTMFCMLKSLAIKLLKAGKGVEEVAERLLVELKKAEAVKRKTRIQKKRGGVKRGVFIVCEPGSIKRKKVAAQAVTAVEGSGTRRMRRVERKSVGGLNSCLTTEATGYTTGEKAGLYEERWRRIGNRSREFSVARWVGTAEACTSFLPLRQLNWPEQTVRRRC